MANLLPIGNQLVVFILFPLFGTVRLLEQFITHMGLTLLWWEVGEGSYYPGKDKLKASSLFVFDF